MTKITAYVRIACFSSLALLTLDVRAQLEGQLFTDPDEREYLDYLRQEFLRDNAAEDFNIADVEIPEIPDEVAAQASGPVEYSFGGVMARRDGIRVWLNGNLLAESELPEGFSVFETGRSFSMRIARDGKTFVLLPGQTVDVTAGTVIETPRRPQPAAEVASTPSVEAAVDEAPEDSAREALQPAAEVSPQAPEESAEFDRTVASQEADVDTDALTLQAGKLDDEEVDALFEILENARLERNTGEEPDEESDNEAP